MTPRDLTKQQKAQLVRAAIAYAGLTLKEVAEKTGIKESTLGNYTGVGTVRSAASLETRLKIGRECLVPDWFMEGGFTNRAGDDDLRETVRQLAERVGELELWQAGLELEGPEQPGEGGSGDSPARPKPRP